MFDTKVWQKQDFNYGGVDYRILPMTKRNAVQVFEIMRSNIALHSDVPMGTLLPFIAGGPIDALIESVLILSSAMSMKVIQQLREIAWSHLEFYDDQSGQWVLMSDDAAEYIIPDNLAPAASVYWLAARTLIHHQVGDISDIRAVLFPELPNTTMADV